MKETDVRNAAKCPEGFSAIHVEEKLVEIVPLLAEVAQIEH